LRAYENRSSLRIGKREKSIDGLVKSLKNWTFYEAVNINHLKEIVMLQVTEKATVVIKEFLQGKDLQSIRIMMTAGCGGPNLGMALDEPKETDAVIKDNGLTFLIDKTLYEDARPITVDFIDSAMGSGFKLSSSLAAIGGGCGGGCKGCG